jgi:ABC-2 type transport system permease protein
VLRLLRVEVDKLLYSRVFYASLALFLVYALVLLVGFRQMMSGFGIVNARQSGMSYLYLAFVLAFYPFITSVAIVLAAGSVSSELHAGTLRYALLAPLSRWEYVMAKFLITVVGVGAAMVFLFLALVGLGTLLFGSGNVVAYDLWSLGKAAHRDAIILTEEETLRRCLLAIPLMLESAVANAGLAFFVSTLVASPVLAITIPLSMFFISSIIQFSPFLPDLKPFLPTRHMFFWDDVFSYSIPWDQIGRGALIHGVMIVGFVSLATLVFVARDISA